MALGSFNVGRDTTAIAIAPNGTRLELSGITGFRWKPKHKDVSSSPMNAPTMQRFLPDGHEIEFDLDRNGPENEALFAQIEAGWWSIGSADSGTSANGTVYFYINELDGSQTTHQFSGVAMKLTNGGDFKSEQAVKQTIHGHAQRWSKA